MVRVTVKDVEKKTDGEKHDWGRELQKVMIFLTQSTFSLSLSVSLKH